MIDLWAGGLLLLIVLVYLAVGSVLRELNQKIEQVEANLEDAAE